MRALFHPLPTPGTPPSTSPSSSHCSSARSPSIAHKWVTWASWKVLGARSQCTSMGNTCCVTCSACTCTCHVQCVHVHVSHTTCTRDTACTPARASRARARACHVHARACVCVVPRYVASARHGMAHGWRGSSTARNNALRAWDDTGQQELPLQCSRGSRSRRSRRDTM
jgi:hypothetical protein